MREHPNVMNEQDLEWGEQSHGEKFGYRRKQLSSAAARAQGLALSLPPRQRGGHLRSGRIRNAAARRTRGRPFAGRLRSAAGRRDGGAPGYKHYRGAAALSLLLDHDRT